MNTTKIWLGLLLIGFWSMQTPLQTWAQTAPFKVSVARVSGAAAVSGGSRDAKLRVELQNMSSKALEGIHVEWTFVVEDDSYSSVHRTFSDGDKTVDLKALATMKFDTDAVELARQRYGPKLRGHWAKVSYGGKTIFEEYNPQTVKKYVEQHQKSADKEGSAEPK